jgi:hypothetical protein
MPSDNYMYTYHSPSSSCIVLSSIKATDPEWWQYFTSCDQTIHMKYTDVRPRS